MATLHEPLPTTAFSTSLSSSSIHLRPNPATTLPQLNFNFDDLRQRMSDFSARFDDFIERGRKKVLEERNMFRMSVAGVQEQSQQTSRAIASTTSLINTHTSTLSAQSAETAEMATTIASLTSARDANLSTVAHLRTRLAESKRAVVERRDEQKRYENWLGGMREEDGREVGVWEGLLGVRVESASGTEGSGSGKEEERLKFVFTGLGGGIRGNAGVEKEASFVLDVGRRGYTVLSCDPELDREHVETCERVMSENEDLAGFLKGMRGLFVKALE